MAGNPLTNIYNLVDDARRFRDLARDPAQRSRREVLVPIFTFFDSQLPIVGFVPMHIAVKRLEDKLYLEGLDRAEKVHLKCLKRSIARDLANQTRGGTPRDLIKFRQSDHRILSREENIASKANPRAFWQQRYDDMLTAWGSQKVHSKLGLDRVTIKFLCHLDSRLTDNQKKQLLQNYRDYKHKLTNDIKRVGFDTIWDGVPEFQTEVHSEIVPRLGPVDIEKAYGEWAGQWKMPKRVTTPLLALARRLRRPLPSDQIDLGRAFWWYGSKYDPSLSARMRAVGLAACVVAAENWHGAPYQLDERMEKLLRQTMRADKKFFASVT